jgi:PTH1 family peptidyl-tRNA hydrolase
VASEDTYLIAGLGNPGGSYEGTRHNVGFKIVDAIAGTANESLSLTKWDACYCRVSLWGAKIYFVKPQTYMNLSGKAVARFVDFFKISTKNILVVHDDIDMHPGRVKLVAGGGPGGHNGIRSLIECLGRKDFFRLKYGVGRPGENGVHGEIPVDRYVLAAFTGDEESLLLERMPVLLEGVKRFVDTGSQQAMNILNGIK